MQENYSAKVKEHYHHPRNFGVLPKATKIAEGLNAACGDECKIYLQIKNGKVQNLKHVTRGCMLAVAAASVLSELLIGKPTSKIKKLGSRDVAKLLNVKISPAREPCATLTLTVIQKSL